MSWRVSELEEWRSEVRSEMGWRREHGKDYLLWVGTESSATTYRVLKGEEEDGSEEEEHSRL
jgi:hypothetical protein